MRSKWYRTGAVILFLLVLALTACHVQQRTDTGSDQISGRKYRVALVAKSADSVCEQCGKPIEQNPGRKRKRFCCDACRNKWWNAHLELVKRKAVYTYTCPTCGKEFTVYGNSHRKFCSHACYIAYRFGGVRHG